ncbi:tubulin-like doman-containing protein [Desertihabitans brevis]|uniref:tubulin-like doman-containing protein n=1 Tax=Desertihabitans brevis TaxID=2268447 RepID=UPI001314D692|nr:tubulin-like doman-containing protein [Desertihabitans brevis]
MKRFLVVGCGGTGGATLAYMMDQLRADLAGLGVTGLGEHGLPSGWQFLCVDVPSSPDRAPDGLPTVREAGGAYLGLGRQGLAYSHCDENVSARATGALAELGTWAPRRTATGWHPTAPPQSVANGAGQLRAVGRMVLLNGAERVRDELRAAWERVNDARAHADLQQVSSQLGESYSPNDAALVLVVGSMAGGAGSSMTLDLCRMLVQLGIRQDDVATFLATPDTFDALPESERPGVRANGLGMVGEVVSAQAGAARRHDNALLGAIGITDDSGQDVPFKRVFPVGLSGHGGARFGTEPKDLYRALGRGLAALVASGTASAEFAAFDLTNASAPVDTSVFGWGSDGRTLAWGSFGYASLTMGRERYAEYAAQRIARMTVDRMLDGHLQPGNPAGGDQQARDLVGSQWTHLAPRLGVPESGSEQVVKQWLLSTLPQAEVGRRVTGVVDEVLRPQLPGSLGQTAVHWGGVVGEALRRTAAGYGARLDAEAYRWANEWLQQLHGAVLDVVAAEVSRFGLAYGTTLVDGVQSVLEQSVGHLRSMSAATVPPVAVPPRVSEALARTKGQITGGTGGDTLLDSVLESATESGVRQLYVSAAGWAARGAAALARDVLPRLRSALVRAAEELAAARRTEAGSVGVAVTATDAYAAWPQSEVVPSRFEPARNEVTLTPTAVFRSAFEEHLRRALAGAEGHEVTAVPRAVASGRWPVAQGEAPGGLLDVQRVWVAREFVADPDGGEPLMPTLPDYHVGLAPAEVLQRARAFVARPDESFDSYCRVSLRSHVQAQLEHDPRSTVSELTTKLGLALRAARPLTGIDEHVVNRTGGSIDFEYKFSAVPFDQMAVLEPLRRVLAEDRTVAEGSLQRFDRALATSSAARRVDIFGSHMPVSPVAFAPVLNGIRDDWNAASSGARQSFWLWRRARPLTASVPMTEVERRTLAEGWLIGLVTGRLQLPPPPYTDPVQVVDGDGTRLAFPHPLLTPRTAFVDAIDWFPAVLESSLLALAGSSQTMESMRPYRALRSLADDSPQGPVGPAVEASGVRLLRSWLTDPAATSSVRSIREAAPAERAGAARQWLVEHPRGPGALVRAEYLAPGGRFFRPATRTAAGSLPLMSDLAPEFVAAAERVAAMVEVAAGAAPDDLVEF